MSIEISQSLIYGWAGQAGTNQITAPVVVTGSGEDNRSFTVTGGSHRDINLGWGAGKLISIFVYSRGGYSLVLNPTSTHPETIIPDAGHPIQWDEGSGLPYPFTVTAVTEIRITSEQTDDLDIWIKTVIDADE